MSRIASFHAALTDLDTTAQCPLGGILEADNKTYKYVRFSGTTAIAAGDFLLYVASAGATDAMVTVDGANNDTLGAGVAVTAVGTGAVLFGFIQIKGLATLSTALAGPPVVGDALTADGAAAPAVKVAAAVTDQVIGHAFDVTNKLVALDCPY